MEFSRLTEAAVPSYLHSLPAMGERFSSFDALEVVEVGDGNLNYVYLVTNQGTLALGRTGFSHAVWDATVPHPLAATA